MATNALVEARAGKDSMEDSPKPPPQRFQRMPALDGLRYIAAVHILARHYLAFTKWPWLNNLARWGNSATPFFMMLSGFGLAIAYGKREKLPWGTFMIGRLSKLYPMYFVGIIMGFFLTYWDEVMPWANLLVLLLCMTGYVQTSFENTINTPAHVVGGMVLLYAVFPAALHMLKGCSKRQLCWVVQPLLWLLTASMVLVDHCYNFGILHIAARLCNRTRLFNFLQGVVLGLQYHDHNWSKHPCLLQYIGLTVPSVIYWFVVVRIDSHMPYWLPDLRRVCLLTPLQLCMMWYGARGWDPLCRVFGSKFFQTLGGTAYGLCIFQGPFVRMFLYSERWLRVHNWLLFPNGSPLRPIALIGGLTIFSHYLTKMILLPCAPLYTKCATYLTQKWVGGGVHRVGHRLLCVMSDTTPGRVLAYTAFVAFYTFYNNWQPCAEVTCLKKAMHPVRMSTHTWFNRHDYNSLLNWYGLPCDKHQLLPTYITDPMPLVVAGLASLWAIAYGVAMIMQDEGKTAGASLATATPTRLPSRLLLQLVVTDDTLSSSSSSSSSSSHADARASEHQLRTLAETLKQTGEFQAVQVQIVSTAHSKEPWCDEEGLALRSLTAIEATEEEEEEEGRRDGQWDNGSGNDHSTGVVVVGADVRLTAEGICGMLSRAPVDGGPIAFVTHIDGECIAPGIGTLAQLSSTHESSRYPAVVVAKDRSKMASCSHIVTQAVTTGAIDTRFLCVAPHTHTTTHNTHAHSKTHACVEGVSDPQDCVYTKPLSLSAYVRRRWSWVYAVAADTHTSERRSGTGVYLAAEAMAHLMFVLSFVYLIATPVHTKYTKGDYGRWGNSYDCSNGKGSGLSYVRVAMALIAGLYTGVYVLNALTTFKPSRSVVSHVIYTSVMFFWLPTIAVRQFVFASAACTRLLLVDVGVKGKKKLRDVDPRAW